MRWTWTVMRERVVKYAKEELGTKARNSGVEYRKSRVLSWCRDVYVCWHPIEWGSWRVEQTHFGSFQVTKHLLGCVLSVVSFLVFVHNVSFNYRPCQIRLIFVSCTEPAKKVFLGCAIPLCFQWGITQPRKNLFWQSLSTCHNYQKYMRICCRWEVWPFILYCK